MTVASDIGAPAGVFEAVEAAGKAGLEETGRYLDAAVACGCGAGIFV